MDRSIPPWATRSASDLSAFCLELRIREIVAEQLGVDAADLGREVSLTDDLAVDSLDLLDLALALEAECGIVMKARTLGGIRTYGDLVQAVMVFLADELTPSVIQLLTHDAWRVGPGSRSAA